MSLSPYRTPVSKSEAASRPYWFEGAMVVVTVLVALVTVLVTVLDRKHCYAPIVYEAPPPCSMQMTARGYWEFTCGGPR